MRLNNVYKTVSDERLVIDVVAPLFTSDMVEVKTAKLAGGRIFKVIVKGTYTGRKNKEGVPVPALGYDKHVSDFKYEFADIDDDLADSVCFDRVADDQVFKSCTFFTEDYELDKMVYAVDAGVIRISIPKKASAIGVAVKAVKNADADSTGVPTTKEVAPVVI